jgi:NDP-sugar pyrophosphorylase family protein
MADAASFQAVLLVGGRGTRLQGRVADRPKPLAEVGGRPFVEWLLLSLHAWGVKRVVLCIGYMGEMLREHFGCGSAFGLDIEYSEDPELRGTGGALRGALPLINTDPVLVCNGDTYCDVNVPAFAEWHRLKGALGSVVLVRVDETRRYGRVQVGEEDRIMRFEEKGQSSGPGLVNAGVYMLSSQFIESIPGDRPSSLEYDLFPNWIGDKLYGYRIDARLIDIGTPESYEEANRLFSRPGGWHAIAAPPESSRPLS